MKFVKLTCNYYLDPAIAADLSDAGEVAFTRGIAYCGEAETGGFIPAAVLPSLMRRYTPARGRKVAAELVLSQLWVEVPGGWQIRTWDRQQGELERLLARRRNDAERQQRHRAKATSDQVMSRDIERDASRDGHVTPFACAPSREVELELEARTSPRSVVPFSRRRDQIQDRHFGDARGRDGLALAENPREAHGGL